MGKVPPPPTRPIRNKWTAPYLELTNIHQIIKQLPTSVICPHWFLLKLFVFTFTFLFTFTICMELLLHTWYLAQISHRTCCYTQWNKVKLSLPYRNIFCTAHGANFTASYSCTGQCAKSSPKADCRLRRELLWKRNCFMFLSHLVKPHLEKRPWMRGLMLSL